MAEVRKKIVEDTYNTSKIKVKEKSTKKSEKKSPKKSTKKESNTQKDNYNIIDRIRMFFGGVKSEFLKVHWTSKKDMLKYSIATICFIVFCSLFFYIIYILFALVRSIIG